MIITDDLSSCSLAASVICLGTFDGVHLGHQMLLKRMQNLANEQQQPSVIISFHPPAKVFLQGDKFLSSYEEKLQLLKVFEPDIVVIIPFDFDYAKTTKNIFVEQLKKLQPSYIIVGNDFRFGHQRLGKLTDFSQITAKLELFNMKKLDGNNIKSSYIRMLLKEANLETARRFLGYDYFAIGKVVKGQQRGKNIGFPTANINLPEQKLLPHGVFVVKVKTSKGNFWGMANVGPRPSFKETPPALEVHIFDFSDDIYAENLTIYFKHFLRSQIKFSNIDELKRQLAQDAKQARAYSQNIPTVAEK